MLRFRRSPDRPIANPAFNDPFEDAGSLLFILAFLASSFVSAFTAAIVSHALAFAALSDPSEPQDPSFDLFARVLIFLLLGAPIAWIPFWLCRLGFQKIGCSRYLASTVAGAVISFALFYGLPAFGSLFLPQKMYWEGDDEPARKPLLIVAQSLIPLAASFVSGPSFEIARAWLSWLAQPLKNAD